MEHMSRGRSTFVLPPARRGSLPEQPRRISRLPGPELSAGLQPQARFQTIANRRDWCQYAFNGTRGMKDRLRKALGLGPGDRCLAKVTHADKQCRILLQNNSPVRATNIHLCAQPAVCRIKFPLCTTTLLSEGTPRRMGCAELMCRIKSPLCTTNLRSKGNPVQMGCAE